MRRQLCPGQAAAVAEGEAGAGVGVAEGGPGPAGAVTVNTELGCSQICSSLQHCSQQQVWCATHPAGSPAVRHRSSTII